MNPDFGTNAQAYKPKRVKYTGSKTLRMGMPVCYDWDTTTNVLGVNKADNTRGTTTADGYQNEGKFKLVEDASSNNQRFFAGLLHDAKNLNKAGDGGEWIDIVVPNGAIVPAYTDRSVTAGEAAYLETGENTVINTGTGSLLQIGYFVETVDRSSTAGLALVKLNGPEMASYEAPATLGVGLSPLLWADAPKNVEGRPGNGMHYFDDFQNYTDPATTKPWIITQTDTKGSISFETGTVGGVIQFTSATGDSADDGISAQNPLVAILPAAGTNIWFEARVKVSEADEQWAIGFCGLDTTVIAAGIFDDVTDKILFGHHTGTADKINTICSDGATQDETADVADMADDTFVTVGFKMTGITKIEFYVNGVLVETGSTANTMPNTAMLLTAVAQYEAADTVLGVDWVKVQTDGGRDA